MRRTRILLLSLVLTLCGPLPCAHCLAQEFVNLDFEATHTPLDENGFFSCSPSNDCNRTPSTVMPGWTFSVEMIDRSPPSLPYVVHGSLINSGHIGGTTNIYLTDAQPSHRVVQDYVYPDLRDTGGLQGNHSLVLQTGSSVDLATNFDFEGPLPGDGYAYPVASQIGLIPGEAKSILIQATPWRSFFEELSDQQFGVRDGIPEFLSVWFDGVEVEMHRVELSDFSDQYEKQAMADALREEFLERREILRRLLDGHLTDEELDEAALASIAKPGMPAPTRADMAPVNAPVFYAGNIEPIAGNISELSIRPKNLEPGFSVGYDYTPLVTIDNILFSSSPAPGPPIIPEPGAAALALVAVLSVFAKPPRALRAA